MSVAIRLILLMVLATGARAAEATYFAKIGPGNVVEQVIVADQAFVDKLPGRWVQTWPDGKVRKNYAGIGYIYDEANDQIVPPKPYPSWTLDDATARWTPPAPEPKDGKEYGWDESAGNWKAKK